MAADEPGRVERYYDAAAQREWERLDRHRTEFALTLRAIDEHAPQPPARIIDIGGGPGRYAIALARRGHALTLVDISPACLDFARRKAEEASVRIEAFVHADARALDCFPDASFDAALLMGPLYHLPAEGERRCAVSEARRVLRPGRPIYAAFISRLAPFMVFAMREPETILAHPEELERALSTGVDTWGHGFADAYYAHPDEIVPFMESGGFATRVLVGCEGAIAGCESAVNALSGEAWDAWVDLNWRIGADPAFRAASHHLLYVGVRGG